MFTFVLIFLITTGTVFAVVSLADSAIRGKRAYRALMAARQSHSAPLARIVIVGDQPHPSFPNAAAACLSKGKSRLLRVPANCQLPPSVAA